MSTPFASKAEPNTSSSLSVSPSDGYIPPPESDSPSPRSTVSGYEPSLDSSSESDRSPRRASELPRQRTPGQPRHTRTPSDSEESSSSCNNREPVHCTCSPPPLDRSSSSSVEKLVSEVKLFGVAVEASETNDGASASVLLPPEVRVHAPVEEVSVYWCSHLDGPIIVFTAGTKLFETL